MFYSKALTTTQLTYLILDFCSSPEASNMAEGWDGQKADSQIFHTKKNMFIIRSMYSEVFLLLPNNRQTQCKVFVKYPSSEPLIKIDIFNRMAH